MKKLLLAIAILLSLAVSPARAASPCTAYISAPGPIPPWAAPGSVVCFRAGVYPHAALVRITALSAIYQSAPGEHAALVGPGLDVSGHDFTLAGLEIDNVGAGVPAIVLRGDRETLAGDEIHGGTYNGVDVRGQSDTISDSRIHDFNSGVPQSDAQCTNLISNNLAGSPGDFRLTNNAIWNCSGDGIQAFHANVLPCPPDVPGGIIAGNVFTAGTLSFEENAFDLKWGAWDVYSNTMSGYGFVGQTGGTDTSPAAFVHKCAHDVTVHGNTFRQDGKGFEVFGGSGLDTGTNPARITFTGNIFDRVGPGYLTNIVGGISVTVAPNINYPAGIPSPTLTATSTQPPTATGTATGTATATETQTPTAAPTGTATPVRHVLCVFQDGHVVLDCP